MQWLRMCSLSGMRFLDIRLVHFFTFSSAQHKADLQITEICDHFAMLTKEEQRMESIGSAEPSLDH
jgi:hypothetical protein